MSHNKADFGCETGARKKNAKTKKYRFALINVQPAQSQKTPVPAAKPIFKEGQLIMYR